MSKQARYLALVTHSLSELDVLFPIFADLRKSSRDECPSFEIVIAVNKIYKAYQSHAFYHYCSKQIGVTVNILCLPNKFDHRQPFFFTKWGGRILRAYQLFQAFLGYPRLLIKLLSFDFWMHEYSNQLNSTRPIYWLQYLLSKPIFTYHHGHVVSLGNIGAYKHHLPLANRSTALIFHSHNSAYFSSLGYINQKVIGYPKFFTAWLNLVKDYTPQNNPRLPYVAIFSRHIHPIYMDALNYEKLLLSSYQAIRDALGEVRIVLKPHPREDTDEIYRMVVNHKMEGLEISHEHAAVLSKHAVVGITFWGSVILDTLSVNTPAIEYYIEAQRFRESETGGSTYRNIGITSTSDPETLATYLRSIANNKPDLPKFFRDLPKSMPSPLSKFG